MHIAANLFSNHVHGSHFVRAWYWLSSKEDKWHWPTWKSTFLHVSFQKLSAPPPLGKRNFGKAFIKVMHCIEPTLHFIGHEFNSHFLFHALLQLLCTVACHILGHTAGRVLFFLFSSCLSKSAMIMEHYLQPRPLPTACLTAPKSGTLRYH